jgi:hypothetical protein
MRPRPERSRARSTFPSRPNCLQLLRLCQYNMGFDILDKDDKGFLTRSEVGLESKR